MQLDKKQSLRPVIVWSWVRNIIRHLTDCSNNFSKDGKKARKAEKASKPKKLKIPKKVGSIKIPKELRREGNGLIDALKGLLATEIAAAAITARSDSSGRRCFAR